jgi:hypothetical protein
MNNLEPRFDDWEQMVREDAEDRLLGERELADRQDDIAYVERPSDLERARTRADHPHDLGEAA